MRVMKYFYLRQRGLNQNLYFIFLFVYHFNNFFLVDRLFVYNLCSRVCTLEQNHRIRHKERKVRKEIGLLQREKVQVLNPYPQH
jgi:hypothetical protein